MSTRGPSTTELFDSSTMRAEWLQNRARLHDLATGLPTLPAVVDDVRRRVQQDIHGHRGRKNDPLYRIRNILRAGQERLTDRQRQRLAQAWAADERHLDGSDSLSWPHHDGLGWLHLVGVSGGVTV